jgi:FkbH-like protein
MTDSNLRSKVDRLVGENRPFEAVRELALLWESDTSSGAFIISRFNKIRSSLPLTRCKVAFQRSFTLEPMMPVCQAAAFVNGIELAVQLGPFNMYSQEILDERSDLYRFDPDIVFLAALTSDLAPELWNGGDRVGSAVIEGVVQRVIDHLGQLIQAFRAHSSSNLVIHLLERPAYPSQDVLDGQIVDSKVSAILRINEELRVLARGSKSVFILDYDGLVSRFGSLNWRDEVKWQVARMPIKAMFHRFLAQEWLKFIHPLTGKIAKVAALDLDNTLWGGIVGEDGLAGIKLGKEYPGLAYRVFQSALRELRDRGVLLAICSKNNLDDVSVVFEQHPDMLLKLSDFSAVRINWLGKSENLRSIASELNIGLDSIALIDDNPVERQQVRCELPEVHVVELPDSPIQYADVVRTFPPFERLVLSHEDRERSGYYASQKKVLELRSKVQTKEEFYHSLQQRVFIEGISSSTLARATQLTQKTNQFNLTTCRYSEQQISQLMERPDWKTYTIRVIDRYVDNGLVGVALTHDASEICTIDTFLLSCRVIGRGVETALLSFVVREARNRGVNFLNGVFIPTLKNQPAKTFLGDHGFRLTEDLPDRSLWQLDLRKNDVVWPSWIQLVAVEAVAQ